MKNKKHLTPRQLLCACGLLLAVSLLVCLLFARRQEPSDFQNFSRELYVREMTSNTISLHYSLARPEKFGIRDYPVTLPFYHPGSEKGGSAYLAQVLTVLQSLSASTLSQTDRYACACLERSLLLSSKLAEFPYYSDLLSPTQGIQGQLPILLSEYEFRSKKDVEEYLTLLGQVQDFFRSILLYEQERVQSGILPSQKEIAQVAEQCDTIVAERTVRDGTHFLQTGFLERLQELAKTCSLSDQEIRGYVARNDALLTGRVVPAYQDLKDGLLQLSALAPEKPYGLAALPGGKEYYGYLLAKETGSDKSPEEVRMLLERILVEECEAIQNLARTYPACVPALKENAYRDLGIYDVSVMLNDLKKRMAGDFPIPATGFFGKAAIRTADGMPSATVKSVSPSLQDYSAPAFYLTAPIDHTDRNVIYVNQKTSPKGLELYTTLAHEGYPGHLYQNAFSAAHLLSLKDNELRQLLDCGGYLEGWALYVEQISYDYASQLLAEQDRPVDAVCVQLEKHNRSLQLCLYSLMDVMIHHDGAGIEELQALTAPFGVSDEEILTAIYDYICQTPCNYPKYYLGYLEMTELRQRAMELWADAYNDLRFHQFVLEWGPADFVNLRIKLEAETE